MSRAIAGMYHRKLHDHMESDVVIVGAGPSGMVAGHDLAKRGYKVTILEKRLSPGGGTWGGAMAMNEAVVQDEAVDILKDFGIRHDRTHEGFRVVDSVELAAALTVKAIQAGAVVFNLTCVEDVCIHGNAVTGVVANRTMISEALPIDPIMLTARAVIDGTGHEAAVYYSNYNTLF